MIQVPKVARGIISKQPWAAWHWVLGTEYTSSARVTCILNHWIISPTPKFSLPIHAHHNPIWATVVMSKLLWTKAAWPKLKAFWFRRPGPRPENLHLQLLPNFCCCWWSREHNLKITSVEFPFVLTFPFSLPVSLPLECHLQWRQYSLGSVTWHQTWRFQQWA